MTSCGRTRRGIAQEELHQPVLGARQVDRAVADDEPVRVGIQAELVEGRRTGVAVAVAGARAAQQRSQPRLQLSDVEGLDEVVVGARVEAVDPVLHGVARREHQHRDAITRRAHPAARLETVDAGHADVEQHRVRRPRGDPRQALLASGGRVDLVAGEAERAPQRIAQRAVVVDDEHAHGASDCAGSPASARAASSRPGAYPPS